MTMRLASALLLPLLLSGGAASAVAQSSGRPSVFATEDTAPIAPRAPGAATWYRVETAHFALHGDVPAPALRALGADLEALASLLAALNPEEPGPPPPRAAVYVFATAEAFSRFAPTNASGEPAPVSGFFVSHPHGDFVAVSAAADPSIRRALYHEALHLYVSHHLPGAPLWLNEGLAEFYSTLEVGRGEAWVGRPVVAHVVRLGHGPRRPLSEVLAVDATSHAYLDEDGEGSFYAEAWALVHYLLTGGEAGRAELARFAGLLRSGDDPGAAFAAVWGDPVVLERRVDEHLRRAPREPVRALLPEPPREVDRALPMSEADLDYRLGWLQAHHSPPRTGPARALFEAALRAEPGHAGAIAGMGWLEELEGDHDEARRRYASAIELDPEDPLPRFLEAQSLLRSAGAVAETGRGAEAALGLYRAARAGFRRALELEPGLAEAWAGLGAAWVADRSPANEGLDALRQAYRRLPTRDDVLYNLMLLEARLGSRARAEALYARLAERADPERAARGREALLRVDLETAERLVRDDRADQAIEIMGRVLAETGDRDLQAAVASRLAELERARAGRAGG